MRGLTDYIIVSPPPHRPCDEPERNFNELRPGLRLAFGVAVWLAGTLLFIRAFEWLRGTLEGGLK